MAPVLEQDLWTALVDFEGPGIPARARLRPRRPAIPRLLNRQSAITDMR